MVKFPDWITSCIALIFYDTSHGWQSHHKPGVWAKKNRAGRVTDGAQPTLTVVANASSRREPPRSRRSAGSGGRPMNSPSMLGTVGRVERSVYLGVHEPHHLVAGEVTGHDRSGLKPTPGQCLMQLAAGTSRTPLRRSDRTQTRLWPISLWIISSGGPPSRPARSRRSSGAQRSASRVASALLELKPPVKTELVSGRRL